MGSVDRKDSTIQLLNRLRMRQVALLLAIHEEHTLHQAANRLGLSQPAATKMLHELEETLGFHLFNRVHRRLQINEAGMRVTEYFQSLHGTMEALNRELTEIRQGSAGRLAIGCIMAASPGRLTNALLQLKQRYPLLNIEVAVDTSNRLMAQLREGVLEVVIGRMSSEQQQDHFFKSIDDEALSVIAAIDHPLSRKKKVRLEDMLEYGWIVQPVGSPMRTVVDQEFLFHKLDQPRGLIETGSMLTSMNLVRNSELISVVPATVARYNAEHGLLTILPFKFQQKLEEYGSIVRRDRALSAAARQFLELIHEDVMAA